MAHFTEEALKPDLVALAGDVADCVSAAEYGRAAALGFHINPVEAPA